MIAKVVRGWRPAGLVAYLFGPGRFEEHRDPRVVASWDRAPWVHQPEKLPGVVLDGEALPAGEFDFYLKPLVRSMRQVADWSGLPTSTPRRLPAEWADRLRRGEELPADAPAWAQQYRVNPQTGLVELRAGLVWHCSVRLHPDDPVLDDARWETIAVRLMRATGIDQAGCRWIAVRHADDHIHLMAVLVSERTGRRVEPFRDFVKLRAECRAIERDLGLVSTAPIDRTAAPAPTRAEKAKADRLGQSETVREELRRIVEQCAATTYNPSDFLTALKWAATDPRTVRSPDGAIVGYTVSRPHARTAKGGLVRYSGSALAPDLTWPKLHARWTGIPPVPRRSQFERVTPDERRNTLTRCTQLANSAAQHVRAGQEANGIAHATGELLTVLGRGTDGIDPGPLTALASVYNRAARTPHHVIPTSSSMARELRHAARQLASLGHLGGRSHAVATAALLLALASLVAEIAAWQQHHGRTHQATAADTTAQTLAALAPPPTRTTPNSTPSPKAALPGARPTTWRPGSQSYDPRSIGRRR